MDKNFALDLVKNSIEISVPEKLLPKKQYEINRSGSTSDGTIVDILLRWLSLNDDGSKFGTRVLVSTADARNAYFIDDKLPQDLPLGFLTHWGIIEF